MEELEKAERNHRSIGFSSAFSRADFFLRSSFFKMHFRSREEEKGRKKGDGTSNERSRDNGTFDDSHATSIARFPRGGSQPTGTSSKIVKYHRRVFLSSFYDL